MNPSDADSPLATLRQLKELLDAGTLTPQEFEALKRKLVFGEDPAAPTPVAPIVLTPTAALTAALTAAPPEPPTPFRPEEAPAAPAPTKIADWQAIPAPLLVENPPYSPAPAEAAEQRNPLTLVFAIGGALLLLALVLYLTLGSRATDEHLTSTSQTAADSTAVAPEVGPQAQQITLPPATAPETVRVAPALPPPVVPNQFRRDTVVAPVPATVSPASTTPPPAAAVPAPAPAKAAPKLAPATPAPAPTPADTAAGKSGQP